MRNFKTILKLLFLLFASIATLEAGSCPTNLGNLNTSTNSYTLSNVEDIYTHVNVTEDGTVNSIVITSGVSTIVSMSNSSDPGSCDNGNLHSETTGTTHTYTGPLSVSAGDTLYFVIKKDAGMTNIAINIDFSGSNNPPVANAGADQAVTTASSVTLDGSGSSDAESDPLTYAWTMTSRPSGSTAALSNATTVAPSFTADVDGAYVIQLVVNDGTVDSAVDSVTITASTARTSPLFSGPIPDQSAEVGTAFSLDTSTYFTETDSDTITYTYTGTLPGGLTWNSSTGVISGIPTTEETQSIVITGTDDDGATSSNSFTITVSAASSSSGGAGLFGLIHCGPINTLQDSDCALASGNDYSQCGADLQSGIDIVGTAGGVLETPRFITTETGKCYETAEDQANDTNSVPCTASGGGVPAISFTVGLEGGTGNAITATELTGDLDLTGNLTLNNEKRYYTGGKVTMGGVENDTLTITGDVELHIEGTAVDATALILKYGIIEFTTPSSTLKIFSGGIVEFSGSNEVGLPDHPTVNFQILSKGDVKTGSDTQIRGLIYTDRVMYLGSNLTLHGSVTGSKVIDTGSEGTTVDASENEGCESCCPPTPFDINGNADMVDKYATDGYTAGAGLKTRVAQKSYAPDTTTDPNLYSVDAVYLEDNGSVAVNNSFKITVLLYLANEDCSVSERLLDVNGDWAVAVIKNGTSAGSACYYSSTNPAESTSFTFNSVHREKRYGMRFIDYGRIVTQGPTCWEHSSPDATSVPGLPTCVAAELQYKKAFGEEAWGRCRDDANDTAIANGLPCEPNNNGYGNPPYDHPYGCYECTLGGTPGVCSTDNFAIRPDHFDLGMSDADAPHLLRAGEEYGISLTAYDADAAISGDYNVTNLNENLGTNDTRYFKDGTEDTGNLLHGTSEVNTSAPAWSVGGLSSLSASKPASAQESIIVSYDDVGKITLQVYDQNWSAVDNDDTPMDCNDSHAHTYICGDRNVTFIPHHFGFAELNITNHAGPDDSNFTYIADNRGMPSATPPTRSPMAARVQTRIKALTKDGSITLNFKAEDASYPYHEVDETTRLYYENKVNVSFVVTVPSTGTNKYLYPDANETNTTTISDPNLYNYIGFGRTGIDSNGSGTRDILWNESDFPLEFNFQREINEPGNPFDVNGSYLKSIKIVSHYDDPEDGDTADINGSRLGDWNNTAAITACASDDGCVQNNAENNATFYYARTRSAQSFYDNVTTSSKITPIYVDVYCNLGPTACNIFGINTVSGQVNFEWWLSWNHQMSQGDGNISLTVDTVNTPNGTVAPTEPNIEDSEGADESVTVTYTGTTTALPYTVNIDFVIDDAAANYTNEWLIYNKDGPYTPSPFYRVEFIGAVAAEWAGHGDTGFVVESNTTTKTNKRLGW